MNKVIPIPTLHLFAKLDEQLIMLLKSLRAEDWQKPTLAKLWTVKDVATHLLDGNIRMISMSRDGFFGEAPGTIESYQQLVDFLNRLNSDWVIATKRMSPAVLIELLEVTGKEYCACIQHLNPFEPAMFSVAWAGQAQSPNWFHIAREYTEKWHHQQQIREAVNNPGILMEREFYVPLIETFMQALPHTYRNVRARPGSAVHVNVTTAAGGDWYLTSDGTHWSLQPDKPDHIHVVVQLDPATAWKLFTKALTRVEAAEKITLTGDVALGEPVFSMLAVMA